ncbi:MAG: hypothetical protein ACFB5Z_14365 [Elainellaceae cyanobacterium]
MGDRGITNGSLKGTYLALLLLLSACFGVHFTVRSNDWLSGFSLDVAAEVIGILLVIFSVDRVIDAEQERQRRKLEKVALRQMYKPLQRHVAFLARLGGEATLERMMADLDAENGPTLTLEGVFNEAYLAQAGNIDLQARVPSERSHVIWSKYLLRECAQFREALNLTIEKYSLFVPPEFVNTIESVANSAFLWDALQLPYAANYARAQADDRPGALGGQTSHLSKDHLQTELQLLVKEHVDAFLTLIALYNQRAEPSLQITYASEFKQTLERQR